MKNRMSLSYNEHRKSLIFTLQKHGFGKNFIPGVKILLRNQESCVLNGSTTPKYFLLRRNTHQGDPISAFYLFYT